MHYKYKPLKLIYIHNACLRSYVFYTLVKYCRERAVLSTVEKERFYVDMQGMVYYNVDAAF